MLLTILKPKQLMCKHGVFFLWWCSSIRVKFACTWLHRASASGAQLWCWYQVPVCEHWFLLWSHLVTGASRCRQFDPCVFHHVDSCHNAWKEAVKVSFIWKFPVALQLDGRRASLIASALVSRSSGSQVLCCVLGQDTLIPQCLSPPRCINGYWRTH